jgi:hypothetical protein
MKKSIIILLMVLLVPSIIYGLQILGVDLDDYYISTTGDASIDGDLVAENIIPNSTEYRDIRAFGAVCDGTTDDAEEIIQAMNCSNCVVYIPPSENGCLVQYPWLMIYNDNITIVGEPGQSLLKTDSGNTGRFRMDTGVDNVYFYGIVFDAVDTESVPFYFNNNGNHDNITLDNVIVKNVDSRAASFDGTNILIKDSQFLHVQNGLGFDWVDGDTDHQIKVINTIIEGTTDYGDVGGSEYGEGIDVNVYDAGTFILENSKISGFGEELVDINIAHAIVTNNEFQMDATELNESTGVNIFMTDSIHGYTGDSSISVTDNYIYDVPEDGVGIYISATDHAYVAGNFVKGVDQTDSYGLRANTNTDYMTATGNTFMDLTYGIYDSGSHYQVFNHFDNCSTDNAYGSFAIATEDDNLYMDDGLIYSGSGGAYFGGGGDTGDRLSFDGGGNSIQWMNFNEWYMPESGNVDFERWSESGTTRFVAEDTGAWHNMLVQNNFTVNDNMFIGDANEDHCTYFYSGGSYSETWCWEEGTGLFSLSDDVYTGGYLNTNYLQSRGDIFSTGSGDDLWIGTETEGSALVHLDTDGTVYAKEYELSTDSTNHYIEDNSTCVIIHGDTSTWSIC